MRCSITRKPPASLYQAALRAELHSRLGVVFGPANCARAGGNPRRPDRADDRLEQKDSANRRRSTRPSIADYEADPRPGADPRRARRGHQNRGAQDSARQRTREQCVGAARPVARRRPRSWVGLRKPCTLPSRRPQDLAKPFAVGVTARTEPLRPESPLRSRSSRCLQAGRRRGVFSRADLTIEIAAALPVLAADSGADQVLARRDTSPNGSVGHWTAMRLGAPPCRCHPAGLRHQVHQPRSAASRSGGAATSLTPARQSASAKSPPRRSTPS